MREFVRHFVLPLAKKYRWRSLCEIGASMGQSTDWLLRFKDVSAYSIIDPCLDADLISKYADDPRVKVHKGNSLDVLPNIREVYDCILIDGDHNWYTVYNELRLIRLRGLLSPGGMIFLHDVGWPFGRRDMYYQPETIPAEYRHPYLQKGIAKDSSDLQDSSTMSSRYNNATGAGGIKNGVLTAVEDFLRDYPGAYNFCRVRVGFGLGILQYRQNRLAEDTAFTLVRCKAGIYSIFGIIRDHLPRSNSSAGTLN